MALHWPVRFRMRKKFRVSSSQRQLSRSTHTRCVRLRSPVRGDLLRTGNSGRDSNENTNGLLRQYFPKKTDLSVYSQVHLNKSALRLNQRPRETLGFQTPASKLQASVASTG